MLFLKGIIMAKNQRQKFKELGNSIWPMIVGDALIISQAQEKMDWVDVENIPSMIDYLSKVETEDEYTSIVNHIKDSVEYHLVHTRKANEEVVNTYLKDFEKDDKAYDAIKTVFKNDKLNKILTKRSTHKRNIFCWVVGTLLLEVIIDSAQESFKDTAKEIVKEHMGEDNE